MELVLFNLIPTLTFVLVTTFTPGPNNTMSLVSGKNNGYKKSLKFMLGIFTGFFIIMMLCGFFNRILFSLLPSIKPYISIAGSLYMLYLAVIILKSDLNGIQLLLLILNIIMVIIIQLNLMEVTHGTLMESLKLISGILMM